MFDHIIVPVDLSARNRAAIEAARALAVPSGAFITLLHVVETLDLPYEEVADFYDRLEERAAERLAEIAEPLEGTELKYEQLIRFGDPASEIVEFAAGVPRSLVILQSHRVDPERPTRGWATLSYKVAFLAESPILLVKQADEA